MSERRTEIDALIGDGSEALNDDDTARLTELRAAQRNDDTALSLCEPHAEPTAGDTPADPERAELRAACNVGRFLEAAMTGRSPDGAEAELLAETGGSAGQIPIEVLEVRSAVEHRADLPTNAPGTVGVNLAPILPAVFARSVTARLGVEMPQVGSGTYATATIDTSLTAASRAKGQAAESTRATFRTATTTPHRVSARLSIAIEDIAAVGTDNFESALRQNLSLTLSDELDNLALNGDGSGSNPQGFIGRLTDPTDPGAVVTWASGVETIAETIDGGPWAETLAQVSLLVGTATARKFETLFPTSDAIALATYLREHAGGYMASSRMPAPAGNIAAAVVHRSGAAMLDGVGPIRTATCPVWAHLAVDDVFSDSASGERHVTLHALVGDVIVTHPDAYERVEFKLA